MVGGFNHSWVTWKSIVLSEHDKLTVLIAPCYKLSVFKYSEI